jgi:tetratricopeptide (TPR) repeat protein
MPVSKNRRKKVAPEAAGRSVTVAELPDRHAMEAAAAQGRHARDEALAIAREIIYKAADTDSTRAIVAAAHQALAASPLCADAYSILAGAAASNTARRDLYARAVEAGALALGPEGFEEYAGQFWGFVETRPYMQARVGLAATLQRLGEDDAAIGHYRSMLELNPNDNQGIRDLLAALLLRREDFAALKDLLTAYEEDASALWIYTRALLAYREGGASDETALQLASDAWAANQHVPARLASRTPLVPGAGNLIAVGGPSEATYYVQTCGAAWRRTHGAVAWLNGVSAALAANRRSR